MASSSSPSPVLIVGFGFSGICLAIKLDEAGIPWTAVEKERDIGGTWLLNSYPGAACDVPAHLYSFSFAPKRDWSEPYAPQPEILEYLRGIVDDYDLRRNLRLNTAVDEARWNADACHWDVMLSDGTQLQPRFMLNCLGGLHHISMPEVPGRDSFRGPSFHTSEWDDTVQLEGKRVAVVGSAASAVQVVPRIAPKVSQLVVLQRTPNWISSRKAPLILPAERYSGWQKWILQNVPGAAKLHRAAIYTMMETFYAIGVFDSDKSVGQRLARFVLERDMRRRLQGNEELIAKCVPRYGVGCKRVCRTDDYLETLQRPNVKLVAHGLAAVEPDAVVDSAGERHEVDVIIYATGFQVGSIGKTRVEGREGCVLTGTNAIDDSLEAYMAAAMPKFPNFFFVTGPNSALGHNSIILIIESQCSYIVRMLREAIEANAAQVEVRQDRVDAYYAKIWPEFEKRVWQNGHCESWYQNKQGKILTLWPSSTVSFMWQRAFAPPLQKDYNIVSKL